VNQQSFQFKAIGQIHSCYKEKFAIPRQAGLVKTAMASIELYPPYNHPDSLKGIDEISHLWISFIFHEHLNYDFKNLVNPPRLNGEKKGVYATRSPFRPNPLGLSVVKLERIRLENDTPYLEISGGDFLDKTPVVDIKPYIQYADIIKEAYDPYSLIKLPQFKISFTDNALLAIEKIKPSIPSIKEFILELLAQDPRPIYTRKIKSHYSAKLYDYDLTWNIEGEDILVLDLLTIKD